MHHVCATLQDSPVIMLERSVYSARYCFVENLHRRCVHLWFNVPHGQRDFVFVSLCVCSGVIDDMEYGCYCQWFDYVLKQNRPQLDLIGK